MRKIFTVCGVLISAVAFSQTRVNYNLTIIHPDKSERKYNMNLDVYEAETYFYDEKMLENNAYHSKSNQFLVHHISDGENSQIVFNHENFPFKIHSQDKIVWKLENEFKEIDHHKVQKATADFGERSWIAWFSPDMSMNEGPYKFKNLPGLIFELGDRENVFFYQLVSIEKLSNTSQKLSFDFANVQDISVEKYDKMMGDFLDNPFLKQRNQLGNGVELNIDDQDIRVQDLNKMTAEFRKTIKNQYPPAVEVDQFRYYKQKILK